MRELQGVKPEEEGAQELGFGSIEAMRTQLSNWGAPDWIARDNKVREEAKKPKLSPRKRQARSSGPVIELPPAKAAAPLFQDRLEVLTRAVEELEHRKEKFQGGRFVQSAVYWDPVYVSRDLVSEEQWQSLREHFDLEPDAKEHMHFGGASFSLGGGTPTPQPPLPALIGAYLLAGGTWSSWWKRCTQTLHRLTGLE